MEKLHKEKEVTGMYLSGHPLDDFQLDFKTFVSTPLDKIEEVKHKEISIAGIVTECYEKISKNNKPYGGFTLEDYTGNVRITMWSEDYLKYRHLITSGQILYLKGTNKLRFNSTDQYEFKVNSVMLLAEVREKLLTQVTFTIRSEQLANGFVNEFKSLLESHKGSAVVRINVIDNSLKLNVSATSTKHRISLENDMIEQLNAKNIEFKLN